MTCLNKSEAELGLGPPSPISLSLFSGLIRLWEGLRGMGAVSMGVGPTGFSTGTPSNTCASWEREGTHSVGPQCTGSRVVTALRGGGAQPLELLPTSGVAF